VTKAVGPLIDAGYLTETDLPDTGPLGKGRPARPLQVRADQEYFVGIKITPRELIGVLTNLRAEIQLSHHLPLADTRPDSIIGAVTELVDLLRNENTRYRRRTRGIGLSSGGHLDRATGVMVESTFLNWHDVPLADPVERATRLPVVVENDVRALTIVEHWFGHGRAAGSFAVVTLGEGIGSGLVVDGKLTRGSFGTAGELGHIPLDPTGTPCHCGSRGCVEAIASEPAILGEIRSALANPRLTIAEALARAQTGCGETTAILRRAAQTVGRALATVANLVGTELIVLSSEHHRFAHFMQAEIEETFRQHLSGPAPACRLITVQRPFEDWARGAAAVAIDNLFDPHGGQRHARKHD
jgi:predicted NBD/HSP70 family sugar kinase